MNPDAFLGTVMDVVSTWGLQVLGAVAVLVVGWIAARGVRSTVRRSLDRSRIDPTLVPFLTSASYWAVLVFVGVAVLSLFGIETTSFVAVLGAAGFAVGLAFQGTLSNFSSGVMLLLFRPFEVGDFVEVGDASGEVVEIALFSTKLHTTDNVRVVVPNSSVYGSTIRNYTANDTRRVDLTVGIDYGDDIGGALETVGDVVAADDRVLEEPAPTTAVAELGDSAVSLMVRPWCRTEDYWDLRRDLTRALKERLEAEGYSLPFPQRDVHLFREEAAES